MASAARKKQLRQEANAAKGKTTRSYKWQKTNKWGGPPKGKARKPKTKGQIQAQYEKDQNRISELENQLAEEQRERILACAAAETMRQTPAMDAPNTLQEEIRNLMEEVEKQKKEASKWEARYNVLKARFKSHLEAASSQP